MIPWSVPLLLSPDASARSGPDGFLLQDSRGTGVFISTAGTTVLLTRDVLRRSELSCNGMQVTLERRQRRFRARHEAAFPRGRTRYVMTRGRAVCRDHEASADARIRANEPGALTVEVRNAGEVSVAVRLLLIASIPLDLHELEEDRWVSAAEIRLHRRDERRGVGSRIFAEVPPYCLPGSWDVSCPPVITGVKVTDVSPEDFDGVLGVGEGVVLTVHLEESAHHRDVAFAVGSARNMGHIFSVTPFVREAVR